MSDQSAIEWTDATWNPVRGCTKVSPGCANCYAETFAERFRGVKGHPYEHGFDLRLVPEKLKEPLTWKKPRRVFVNSMSDLFQNDVPFAYIDKVFAVMGFASQHTFQVLTKRADRMLAYVSHIAKSIKPLESAARDMGFTFTFNGLPVLPFPLRNVWLGVSVENQRFADERIPLLLQTPATIRFVSYEPALEYVNFRPWRNALDWIIFGLESGNGARGGDADWGRDLIDACTDATARPFIKQLGRNGFDSARTASGQYESLNLKSKKGGDMSEWPTDLRVREFPNAKKL